MRYSKSRRTPLNLDNDMVIDFHTNIGQCADTFCDPVKLLIDMDTYGVDVAVVCPTDRYLAVANTEGNNYIAESVAKSNGRFIGFGCVSPWYGEEAVREIRRIKALGLRGLKVHSFYQGFMLSDRIADPIFEECMVQSLPVLVHTGTPISAMPFQAREVALRFPELIVVIAHMGFSDFWLDASASADLPNTYLEYSYQMHSVISGCLEDHGAEKILFGSDWPFSHIKIEMDKAGLAKSDTDKKMILGMNAARILGI